jgi:glycosyltransferase involved in cell wall biosynthesis
MKVKNNLSPLVSTLICTYNAEIFFDATISSVLQQTYLNQEILILDDWSSDWTIKLLKSWASIDPRICLFIQPWIKRGPYWWLNFLLSHARWEYIAIQDHDDIRHKDKISKQVKFMESHPEVTWCGTKSYLLIESENSLVAHTRKWWFSPSTAHTSLLYRAWLWVAYDITLSSFNDVAMMRSFLWEIYNLNFYWLIHRRRHMNSNLSFVWFGSFKSIFSAYCNDYISLRSLLYFWVTIIPWVRELLLSRQASTSLSDSEKIHSLKDIEWFLDFLFV